jgi:hypothetical protein
LDFVKKSIFNNQLQCILQIAIPLKILYNVSIETIGRWVCLVPSGQTLFIYLRVSAIAARELPASVGCQHPVDVASSLLGLRKVAKRANLQANASSSNRKPRMMKVLFTSNV